MAQCDMGYDHPDAQPEVVMVDDGTADAAESEAVAAVEVARIEADRDVAVAKIVNRGLDADVAAELAAMAARIEVLEAAAIPEPEPEPIVMPMPEPEPAPAEAVAPPAETAPKAEAKKPARKGFFG